MNQDSPLELRQQMARLAVERGLEAQEGGVTPARAAGGTSATMNARYKALAEFALLHPK
jgi:hypothetical protein